MSEVFELDDITIHLTRTRIKNVHLTVHPPDGRVSLVAPQATRTEVARAYAISRFAMDSAAAALSRTAARAASPVRDPGEPPHLGSALPDDRDRSRCEASREARPPPHSPGGSTGADQAKKAEVIHEWHKALLHAELPSLIAKWELKLDVKVNGDYLQRMKTKWGSCNHRAGNIRLNTELVKKPKDLLEYVVVHETLHLLVPTHSDVFLELLDSHYSGWREARADLNALALSA